MTDIKCIGDTCPYVHCRICKGCPAENGFGAFGHCDKCLAGEFEKCPVCRMTGGQHKMDCRPYERELMRRG